MDGWITIGTKLETDKFDKEVAELERKIENAEKKQEIINQRTQQYQTELIQVTKNAEDLSKEYDRISNSAKELKALQKTAEERGNSYVSHLAEEKYNTQINSLKQLEDELNKADSKQADLSMKIQESKLQYDKVEASVQNYKAKIENINLNKQKSDLVNINKSIKEMNKNVGSSLKHISNLAMGIFSVASAYAMVSRASSTLAQYDKQYSANLQYIQYALAQVIAPVLKYLVNLVGTLLSYINYIAQAWFGVNLFANASAKSFADMSNSASSTANSAKQIKKQLAGFDEMNVLSSTESTNSNGSGIEMPSFDVSAMQGEVPTWLQWIVDNKDGILAILAGIAAGILAIKLGLTGVKALGIGVLVAGIVYTIESLLKYLNDPSWENFGSIVQGIGVAITGLGILIGSVPLAVAGAIVLIIGTITKYWEQIKGFFQNGIDWLSDKSDWVHEMFGDTIGNIYDTFVDGLQAVLDIFDSIFTAIKGIFDGFITFIKGVFTGDWQMAWEGIKQIFSSVWEGIKNVFLTVWDLIMSVTKTVGSTVGNIVSSAFKAVVNAVLGTIENILNTPIRAINGLIDIINAVPGINLGKLNTFNLPRLKSGGIINYPNNGVMLGGSAIGGEAGAEGVIPLTDSQAMQTLGQAIGKYITINANIINTMNGRIISRQLKHIQGTSDFAYNR